MTANSLASVSLQPPLVSVCVDHAGRDARRHPRGAESSSSTSWRAPQEALSRRFADEHEDRFDGVGYHRSPEGLILLDGALAHIECERHAAYPGGDHTIVIGRVDRRRHRRRAARCSTTAAATPRWDKHGALWPSPRWATELLDDPGADPATVAASLRNIARANRWFGGAAAVRYGLGRVLARRAPRGRAHPARLGTGVRRPAPRAVRWGAAAGHRDRCRSDSSAAASPPRWRSRGRVRTARSPTWRHAPFARQVGGHGAAEPGGASPVARTRSVQLLRDLRPAGPARRGGRRSAPARRSRRPAFRLGAPAARVRSGDPGRRRDLHPARIHPVASSRDLLGARAGVEWRVGPASRRFGWWHVRWHVPLTGAG